MAENNILDPQEAYTLPVINMLENGKAFIMVDRTTNDGFLLNYNTLADAILSKVYQQTMPEDGLKIYFVD